MSETRIRVRGNKSTGELEIEGPIQAVTEWWERLWPEMGRHANPANDNSGGATRAQFLLAVTNGQMPDEFGEFFTEFRSDITDVDKVLVAAAYVQGRDREQAFTTKAANQALLDQGVKVANASESVRRLKDSKRVFALSDGRFRVSATGFDYLSSLKMNV